MIEATPLNAKSLLEVLIEAGLDTASLITTKGLLAYEITNFKDRVRVDVKTNTTGIEFGEVWEKRETMDFQGQEFYVLSKEDLIASKRAAGYEKDLEDVRLLELGDE